ncbi:MAG: trypsin-like serine protease with C-terminal domain [Clostridia bacterium]|jgi:hypothetical protein|nr:trypsin-like serine protease with C-terminal domain [Clostridia bacterium]
MGFILKIAGLVLSEISLVLGNQLFWVLVVVIMLLYKKTSNIEMAMLKNKLPLMQKTTSALFNGLIAGLLGSLLVLLLGITIERYASYDQSIFASGITYIWIIAVLLSLINARYLCFSYAGGIVALINLIIDFPNVYVPGLMALIGILHLIESLLIWIDGYSFSVPIFLKNKTGRIVGGYIMNRMWPIPLVLTVLAFPMTGAISYITSEAMPAWWPLLRQYQAFAYMPFLVPVVLGYSDVALTQSPENRCKKSAARLAVYSVILIALAVAGSKWEIFSYLAALFSPIAHEMLIKWGKREEENGKSLYDPSGEGICILYIREHSAAKQIGLQPGDRILSINNIVVQDESQLAEFLSRYPTFIWLEIKKPDGSIKTYEYQDYKDGISSLGVLIVPKNAGMYFEINDGSSPALGMLKKLLNKKSINISK